MTRQNEQLDGAAEVGEIIPVARLLRLAQPGLRRREGPRAVSITVRGMRAARSEASTDVEEFGPRPRTRGDCVDDIRPCPWVGCKHHLYLDVSPDTGSLKLNFPTAEPWDAVDSCSLDLAERGGMRLEEVGQILNLTRERIRQVETRGLLKLRAVSPSVEEIGAGIDGTDLEIRLRPAGRRAKGARVRQVLEANPELLDRVIATRLNVSINTVIRHRAELGLPRSSRRQRRRPPAKGST